MSGAFRLPRVTPALCEQFRQVRCVIIEDAIPQDLAIQWRIHAQNLADACARTIRRNEDGHALFYRVVTGEVISQTWPELWDFYVAPKTARWIADITGEPHIYTSPQQQSAININVLEKPGNIYRWHFDAVPYTLILFLTDTVEDAGGVLEFWPNSRGAVDAGARIPPQDSLVRVIARAGTAVLMDGSVCYHHVTELKHPHLRLTVPMVFPPTRQHSRPGDLDSYLYGAARES